MDEPNLRRVLVVDDEIALLELLKKYLSRLGYEVTAFQAAQDAWLHFESDPTRYALVIADLSMPEISGQDLVLRMLELNPAMRILVCSGYPFDASALPGGGQARIAFLQKPFLPRMLAEAIGALMR